MSDNASQAAGRRPMHRPGTSIGGHAPLRGHWLTLSRLVWLMMSLLMLGMGIAGIMPRYRELTREAALVGEALITLNITPTAYTIYFMGIAFVLVIFFALPAIYIYLRRQHDWVALLASLMLLSVGTVSSNFPIALGEEELALARLSDFLRASSEGLPIIFLFVFPTGIARPRWTRFLTLFYLAFILITPILYGTALHQAQWPPLAGGLWLAFWFIAGVAAQIYRYVRIASPTQKQQTKWIITGGGIAALVFAALRVARGLFPMLSAPGTPAGVIWLAVEYSIYTLFILPVPVVFAISILRYRLWDIDFLINRTLVYAALAVILAALFGLSLLGVSAISQTLGGEQSVIAVAVASLIFGSTFAPARHLLQRFVDRKFYGINIDYSRAPRRADTGVLAITQARSTLGDYHGLEPIGRGGMAEVYRAIHPTLSRTVAIKVLTPALAADPEFRHRFEREAQIVAGLRHPNIIQLFDYGQMDGLCYMVMEYIAGPTLYEYLRQSAPLPVSEAVQLLEDIAAGLGHAHEQGLVHRDIKPSNIMLQTVTGKDGAEQRAILTDFGIARMIGGTTGITASGMIGTLDYMAPEQIRDAAGVDARADVYSLGILAFQMLTGRLPFVGVHPGAVLIAHLNQPAPDPCSLRRDLPEKTCAAILRSLEKEPASRYAGTQEFAAALV